MGTKKVSFILCISNALISTQVPAAGVDGCSNPKKDRLLVKPLYIYIYSDKFDLFCIFLGGLLDQTVENWAGKQGGIAWVFSPCPTKPQQ